MDGVGIIWLGLVCCCWYDVDGRSGCCVGLGFCGGF